MLSKNYGAIETASQAKESREIIELVLKHASLSEDQLSQIREKTKETYPEHCDNQGLLQHVQTQMKFWSGLNASIISSPWVNCAGESTRKYYFEEDLEEEPHNDQLLFKNEGDTLLQCIGEIKRDEFDALKTAVIGNEDEIYVNIAGWTKAENSEPWTKDEGGLILDPAELVLLAQHINQAIYFIFSRPIAT
ncbi:hypothetical protein D3C74_166320 [compost metagenome]